VSPGEDGNTLVAVEPILIRSTWLEIKSHRILFRDRLLIILSNIILKGVPSTEASF
jgi:hypothetical protein